MNSSAAPENQEPASLLNLTRQVASHYQTAAFSDPADRVTQMKKEKAEKIAEEIETHKTLLKIKSIVEAAHCLVVLETLTRNMNR